MAYIIEVTDHKGASLHSVGPFPSAKEAEVWSDQGHLDHTGWTVQINYLIDPSSRQAEMMTNEAIHRCLSDG